MNKKQIEDLIYQYHWRKKEMDRLSNILWGSNRSYKSVGVAQGGIESTLPKPNTNLKSIPEMDEMDARELRIYDRWTEYQVKVYAIEIMIDYLEDEQHKIILDCMMEGMSYRSIAAHLSVSRTKIGEMKNEMLRQICQKCQI
jgi:hypothetical protein